MASYWNLTKGIIKIAITYLLPNFYAFSRLLRIRKYKYAFLALTPQIITFLTEVRELHTDWSDIRRDCDYWGKK